MIFITTTVKNKKSEIIYSSMDQLEVAKRLYP